MLEERDDRIVSEQEDSDLLDTNGQVFRGKRAVFLHKRSVFRYLRTLVPVKSAHRFDRRVLRRAAVCVDELVDLTIPVLIEVIGKVAGLPGISWFALPELLILWHPVVVEMSILTVTLRVRAFVPVQSDQFLERKDDASVVRVPVNLGS